MAEDPGDDLAIILLNYRRPQNIGLIASLAIEAIPSASVFILDQADTDSLASRTDVPWGQVWYRKAAINGRAGARIRLASKLPFRYFIALDDDIFLDALQIRSLFAALQNEPNCVHGIYGKIFVRQDNKHFGLLPGRPQNGPVSMVNMVYAFDRAHVIRTMALATEMGFPTWEDVKFGDDILLSCSGLRPAQCHDFGRMRICPTSFEKGVAVHTEADFDQVRFSMCRWLLTRGRMLFREGAEGERSLDAMP